jgi:nitrite reductase/ring-hydroxylating ferredoxin subunit
MTKFDRSGNPKRPLRDGRIVTVGRVEDIPEGRSATVELDDGSEIALFNVGGEFYAVENFCPHKGAPLVDGDIRGKMIECAWHGWLFDLKSGHCYSRPGNEIDSYKVLVEDGQLKIEL